jgi:hypothetical protein
MNRMLSALLGLVLVVVGLTIAIEMAVVAAGDPPALVPRDRWYESLRTLRLADSAFLAWAAVTALVGLSLLILQLRPWRPDRVQTNASAGTPLWLSRRSVERRVTAAAAVGGMARPHSTVRGRPARWRVTVRGVARVDRRDSIMATVRAELDRLYAPREVPVTVEVHQPPGRRR